MYNINRRKFLGYFGCSCCSLLLPSCSTVPITERKQLSIIPESRINMQAAKAYENFRQKTKLITSGSQLRDIRKIGKKMEIAVSSFFKILLNISKNFFPKKERESHPVIVMIIKAINISTPGMSNGR